MRSSGGESSHATRLVGGDGGVMATAAKCDGKDSSSVVQRQCFGRTSAGGMLNYLYYLKDLVPISRTARVFGGSEFFEGHDWSNGLCG